MPVTARQFFSVLSKILICLLLTLMVSYHLAAEDSSTSPFPTIDVDLNAGVFKKVLPFDVPFLITGKVTDDVNEVNVKYFESKSVIDNQEIKPDEWEIINPWRRFRGFEGDKFSLLVPPLEVNRYFRFIFSFKRRVADTEVEAFRRRANDAVDRLLRSLGEAGALTVDHSEKLRQQLIKAVVRPGAVATLTAEPGSIFDKKSNPNAVRDTFNKQLTRILDAQNNKYDGIATFAEKVTSAADHLNELILNPVFVRIADNLQVRANKDNAIAALLLANKDALELKLHTPSDVADLAVGSEPGSPSVNLYNVWVAAELDERISRLKGTIRTLNKLNRLVSQVRGWPSLRGPERVMADEINGLTDLIGRSLSDFQEIQGELVFIKESLERRKEEIDSYVSQLGDQVRTDVVVNGTSVGDFNTRHGWYVSADIGLAWAPDLDEVFSYLGTNIYFRPVNKDAPLKGYQFFRRFSVMLGLTLQDLKKSKQRENLIGSRMLVIGAGLRLTDSIRVAGGALVFKEFDPNQKNSETDLALSPFVSLSFDWDVASTLGDLGRAFGITK